MRLLLEFVECLGARNLQALINGRWMFVSVLIVERKCLTLTDISIILKVYFLVSTCQTRLNLQPSRNQARDAPYSSVSASWLNSCRASNRPSKVCLRLNFAGFSFHGDGEPGPDGGREEV